MIATSSAKRSAARHAGRIVDGALMGAEMEKSGGLNNAPNDAMQGRRANRRSEACELRRVASPTPRCNAAGNAK